MPASLLTLCCWQFQVFFDFSCWRFPVWYLFIRSYRKAAPDLNWKRTNPNGFSFPLPRRDLSSPEPEEKSLNPPLPHLLLMARHPRLGDHILYELPTQSEHSQVSSCSNSIFSIYFPPLLKRPKGVKSDSVPFLPLVGKSIISARTRPQIQKISHELGISGLNCLNVVVLDREASKHSGVTIRSRNSWRQQRCRWADADAMTPNRNTRSHTRQIVSLP